MFSFFKKREAQPASPYVMSSVDPVLPAQPEASDTDGSANSSKEQQQPLPAVEAFQPSHNVDGMNFPSIFDTVKYTPAPARCILLIEHPGVQQFLEKNYTGAGESLASRDISNSELLDEISKLQSAFIAQLNDARARLEESCRFYMFKLDAITPHSTLDEFKDLTSHLSRVIESLRSEILMCQNQIDLATTGKGFVQKSVQEFTLGFKGALRTRIARELGL